MRTKEIPPLAGGASNEYADSIISEKSIIVKFNQLFIGERGRYLVHYQARDGTAVYAEIKGTLTDAQLIDHLNGDQTVGTFYCQGGSKFLCFDVDDTDPIKTQGIVTILNRVGLPSHIEFSGSKGYHIWVLFDDTLPIKKLVAFGKWVIGQMGDYQDKIELRPESVRGKGVKLPFGLHHATGKRSCWVDYDLTPYEGQNDYLMQIQPMNRDEVNRCIDEALKLSDVRTLERRGIGDADNWLAEAQQELGDIRPPVSVNSSLRKKAERLIQDGISDADIAAGHGRHDLQFYVALYYKENGYSESEVTDLVTQWALRERTEGRAESSESHIRRDVAKDVRYIFKHDKGLYDSAGRPYEIYRTDVLYASQFKKKSARKVLWAMVIWARIYGDGGQFYMSQRTIKAMTGLSFQTVNTWVNKLITDGCVELVKKGQYCDREASIYRIPYICATTDEVGEIVEATTYRELFDRTYELVNVA